MTRQWVMPNPEQAQMLYRDIVESFSQGKPILLYCSENVVVPYQVDNVTPETPLPAGLPDLLAHLRATHGPPLWVMLSFEGWYAEHTPDEVASMHPGDVAARGHAGDPSVQDAVIIYGVTPTVAWQSVQRFDRTAQGVVAWHEPMLVTGEAMSGSTVDALIAAVRQ